MQKFNSLLRKPFQFLHFPRLNYFSQVQRYEFLNYKQVGSVGVIQINRPTKFNALSKEVTNEINDIFLALDKEDSIGAIVLTGHKDFFASGADILEMKDETYPDTYMKQLHAHWNNISQIKKPIIGAVSGYALGGGCIYALLCDIVVAGNNSKIGVPAIALSIIPICGSTQSLPHLVGKSRAMEIFLTGSPMSASEAQKIGLVNYVYETDKVIDEAIRIGEKISKYSKPIVKMAKECVINSFDLPLSEGLNYEKRMFWSTFAMKDQKEGMTAFIEKREAKFIDS